MKKTFFLLIAAGMAVTAQAQIAAPGNNYIHIGWPIQNVKFESPSLAQVYDGKSKSGINLEFGRTFFFNKRMPVADMIRFGLDLTYTDLQYSTFSREWQGEQKKDYFAQVGIQLGPSVTVTPIALLHLKGYVRYAPSFAMFMADKADEILGGYAGYITTGLNVSYTIATIGFEARWGSSNFHSLNTKDTEGIVTNQTIFGDRQKAKLPGMRIYAGFKF